VLNRTLEIICGELNQIKGKKKWLLTFSKASVKSKIEECTNRLNDAVQIFQVCVFDSLSFEKPPSSELQGDKLSTHCRHFAKPSKTII